MSKSSTMSNILVTIQHDNRFNGQELSKHVMNRMWSLNGVSNVEARYVGATDNAYITIPAEDYRRLIQNEERLKGKNREN